MTRKKQQLKKVYTEKTKEENKEAWNPYHYTTHSIQPIEFAMANDLGVCEFNIVKYVTRWRHKDGVKDLIKAKHYLEFLFKKLNGDYTREALAKEWLKLEQGEE